MTWGLSLYVEMMLLEKWFLKCFLALKPECDLDEHPEEAQEKTAFGCWATFPLQVGRLEGIADSF